MSIFLYTISSKAPNWVEDSFSDYAKRLRGQWEIKWYNLPLKKRLGSKLAQIQDKEAESILGKIPPQAYVIALDENGKAVSSVVFAEKIQNILTVSQNVHFLIGGPEGLTPKLKSRANESWSLSTLTFPHTLSRVILCEQIYRAWSILNNHPYHNP